MNLAVLDQAPTKFSIDHAGVAGKLMADSHGFFRVGADGREWQKSPQSSLFVSAVADGSVSNQVGANASHLAIQTIERVMQQQPSDMPVIQRIGEAMRTAHQTILESSTGNPVLRGMSTSLAMVVVDGWRLYVSHVGDCRVYLVRDGILHLLTIDHTLAQEALDAQRISVEDARQQAIHQTPLRYLGMEGELHIDHSMLVPGSSLMPNNRRVESSIELQAGDVIFLCTDGVSAQLSDEELGEFFGNQRPRNALRQIVNTVLERREEDNITAALLIMPPAQTARWANGRTVDVAALFISAMLALLLLAVATWSGNALAQVVGWNQTSNGAVSMVSMPSANVGGSASAVPVSTTENISDATPVEPTASVPATVANGLASSTTAITVVPTLPPVAESDVVAPSITVTSAAATTDSVTTDEVLTTTAVTEEVFFTSVVTDSALSPVGESSILSDSEAIAALSPVSHSLASGVDSTDATDTVSPTLPLDFVAAATAPISDEVAFVGTLPVTAVEGLNDENLAVVEPFTATESVSTETSLLVEGPIILATEQTTTAILEPTATATVFIFETVAPTATPSPLLDFAATLLEPTVSTLAGPYKFSWALNSELSEQYAFELIFWESGSDPMAYGFSPVGITRSTDVRVDLNTAATGPLLGILMPGRYYNWSVALVDAAHPEHRIRILAPGLPFLFKLEEAQKQPTDTPVPPPTDTPVPPPPDTPVPPPSNTPVPPTDTPVPPPTNTPVPTPTEDCPRIDPQCSGS